MEVTVTVDDPKYYSAKLERAGQVHRPSPARYLRHGRVHLHPGSNRRHTTTRSAESRHRDRQITRNETSNNHRRRTRNGILCAVAAGSLHGTGERTGRTRRTTVQERPDSQRNLRSGIHGDHGFLLGLDKPELHGLSRRGKRRAAGIKYADDPPLKKKARSMMLMVNAMNKTYFAGERKLTCYTCHRNAEIPKVTPTLAEAVRGAAFRRPRRNRATGPRCAFALIKYWTNIFRPLAARKNWRHSTSLVAKGGYQGYDDIDSTPVEIYAKAPGQLLEFNHGPNGDRIFVDDGQAAWMAQPEGEAPVSVLPWPAAIYRGFTWKHNCFFRDASSSS